MANAYVTGRETYACIFFGKLVCSFLEVRGQFFHIHELIYFLIFFCICLYFK